MAVGQLMQTVVNVDVSVVLIIVIATAAIFAVSLSAVVYGINKSSHEFYSRREDEAESKILQLQTKVDFLEKRLDEMTKELLRRYADDPKDYAVAP